MDTKNIDQFIGQQYTEALGYQIKAQTGALVLRVIKYGMAMTMDLQGDRWNVHLDQNGMIKTISEG